METNFSITRYRDSNGDFFTEDEYNRMTSGGASPDGFAVVEIPLWIEFSGKWVDEGIGSYEYWGFKGNDVRWVYEVEDFDSAVDEDDNDWKDRLTDDEVDAILEQCCREGEKNDDDGRPRRRW